MVKVWIDGQCLQTLSRIRGIGRYVQELVVGLSQRPDLEISISFNASMASEAIAARDLMGRWISPRNIHAWQGVADSGEAVGGYTENRKLSEIAIAHHVAALQPDIALSASPFEGELDLAVPLMPSPILGLPLASIFYDAIPHRFARSYLQTREARARYARRLNSYRHFDLNLCISKFARSEVIELTGNKRSVNISAGVAPDILSLIDQKADYPALSGQKYVLYVGALDWRKNVLALVDAFARLPVQLRKSLKLIIAGDQDTNRLGDILTRWREAGLPKRNIKSLGFISDRDLVGLYRSASLVVQPSLMEGFGLTALEAMTCGTPVIGSRTGALPEIIGRQDRMFDPRNPNEIAERMLSVLGDSETAKSAVEDGLIRAREFSWTKTASIAADALIAAAKQRGVESKPEVLSELRKRTRGEVLHVKHSPKTIANVLARAEPRPPSPGRLIVDATVTSIEDHGTGIQRVVKKLGYNLIEGNFGAPPETIIAYCDWDQQWFSLPSGWKDSVPAAEKTEQRRLQLGPGDKVLMLDSSWEFHTRGFNSLHTGRLQGAEIVSCLYDTVPLRFSAFCDPGMPIAFSNWIRSALTYSTGIVCISKAVADELLAMLQAIKFPRRMNVGYWHLGADFATASEVSVDRPSAARPRFLMVGTIEPRKGHRVALDAFEMLWQSGFDADLVIVGKPGWGNDHLIERLRNHAEAGSRLRWEPRVSDEELKEIYRDADALIAASFAEGFGLPIVEARHFGRPAIASDIPVFREVTAETQSTHFFDVGSPSSLADAITKFSRTQQSIKLDTAEQPSWMSWRKSAAELRDVVVSGNWYRTYQPESLKPFTSIFDVGQTAMTGPLEIEARQHALELVEEPIPMPGGGFKIIVRVTNQSDVLWTGRGVNGGHFGVMLGYHMIYSNGVAADRDYPRTAIPLVLAPGDSHYMAVYVPETAARGRAFADVEMMQEHVGWWGSPLRVALKVGRKIANGSN